MVVRPAAADASSPPARTGRSMALADPSGHGVYRPLRDAADPCRMRRLHARRGARLGAMDRQLANEALRRCVLFRRVTVEDLERCTAELGHRHYKRGETIFHAGDPGEAMHIVIEGAVKVELPSPNGDTPAILATIEPGGFFGELALLDGEPRSATVVALQPTETLVLDRHRFERLMEDLPDLRSC